MQQNLAHIAVVVRDYDEAIQYYTNTLGFNLIEDTVLSDVKRWVMVQPQGASNGCMLLLAKALPQSKQKVLDTKQADAFFYFYTRIIFIETMKIIPQKEWSLPSLHM